MDKERLFKHLDQRYSSKRDMVTRIPLGVQPETLWRELLDRRRSRSAILPLYGSNGTPYWYVTTDKMIAASEKIVEELYETDTEYDPYTGPASVSTLEEIFYTGFVEGVQLTMQAAMEFLTSGLPPRDIEEQLITNNRQAGSYAAANLYRTIEPDFLRELVYILTDGMDTGGHDFRAADEVDWISPDGETYVFPSAYIIPDRVSELCAFLAMPDVHPLIKAAAAQAYILVLRPFPEGNERLSRILSCMILIRAGYTFFGDISISALIAKRSYAYFEATANILREENGGDLTYFIEYFLELLSRAVDERKLRIRQNEERDRQAERELARSALVSTIEESSQKTEEGGDTNNDFFTAEPDNEPDMCAGIGQLCRKMYDYADIGGYTAKTVVDILIDRIEHGEPSFTTADIKARCDLTAKQISNVIYRLKKREIIMHSDKLINRHKRYILMLNNTPLTRADCDPEIITAVKRMRVPKTNKSASVSKSQSTSNEDTQAQNIVADKREISLARVRDKLYECAAGDGEVMKKCAIQLLAFIDSGKYSFTVRDIADCIGLDAERIGRRIMRLKERGLVERYGSKEGGNVAVYQFNMSVRPLEPQDYDPEIIEIINRLHSIGSRSKALRISKIVRNCIPKGIITEEDYRSFGYFDRMETDMLFTEQLGLVQKLSDGVYKLCRKRGDVSQELSEKQITTLNTLYKAFCKKRFTTKEAMAVLDISKSCTNAILLQLTSLRLLDCRKVGLGHSYRVSVNPIDQPSMFSTDVLARDSNQSNAEGNAALTPVYSKDVYELLDALNNSDTSIGDRRMSGSLRSCLSRGMIRISDYMEWGYSKNMWHKDMTLARKLGLVRMIKNGCYYINRELSTVTSELTPAQKKGITALYEAFGDRQFSSEMYIATLNYSYGHGWVLLHTLTLMKVLDHKTTEKGNQYKLLVNPDENPEYFDIAA